jgi:hypothetical protein
MNELLSSYVSFRNFCRCLRGGVSFGALLLAASVIPVKAEENANEPTMWIELGGQLERADVGIERFAPDFLSQIDASTFSSPIVMEGAPRYAVGAQGKLTFELHGWNFSASVRYGRSNKKRDVHEQTAAPQATVIQSIPALGIYRTFPVTARSDRFVSTAARFDESHAVLDFQVGRDFGLGLLGRANAGAGLRFAQFVSRSSVAIGANPDFSFDIVHITQHRVIRGQPVTFYTQNVEQMWHLYDAALNSTNSFNGIGPKLNLESSMQVAGSSAGPEFDFDWGLNAALLFGRQKTKTEHRETGRYESPNNFYAHTTVYQHGLTHHTRSRTVATPNVGGFAGFSLRFPNAKVSLGYRADFFFGAMDGGIDVRKTYDRNFYGPYATISVGL